MKELFCFDPEDGFLEIRGKSPSGVVQTEVASICLPDDSVKGVLIAYLAEFFESIGYERDSKLTYGSLNDELTDRATKVRIFRKTYSKDIATDFVVAESNDRSLPDVSVISVQSGSAGFFKNRRIRKDIDLAQNVIPSGWLQPFASPDERVSRFEGERMFQQVCQVGRSLQMYLYSGGGGVLPEGLSAVFPHEPAPVDIECFRFIESGSTHEVWSDRPVVECLKPIDGIIFGCTADNTIVPMRECG